MKKRRVFDETFRKMAVELSYAKGSVQEAAHELGIDSSRITKWRQTHKSPDQLATTASGLSQEQQLIRRLQKELKEAELDRIAEATRYTKKGGQHLLQGRQEIFRFIVEHASQFPVEKMCKVLKVSSSGYYYWRKHPIAARQLKQSQLLDDIRQVHAESQFRYGSPRIANELRERGVKASRNRVARLMHKAAIRSIMYKKYRTQTTDSTHDYPVAKNLLNRDFTADKPGQKWVSDITYIPTGEGWLYLTTVLDLADRKVVGWALSDNLKAADTSVAAWRMALINRRISDSLLFHSDRGVQYACTEFRDQFKNLPIVQSMSRKGNCWDNAVAESFFKTFKSELVNHVDFQTRTAARLATFEYIEGWYNRRRKHSSLSYQTPIQQESHFYTSQMAA